MTQGATTLQASSRHFSHTRGNTRIPYSWNILWCLTTGIFYPKFHYISYRIFLWIYWSFYDLSDLLYSLLDILHITSTCTFQQEDSHQHLTVPLGGMPGGITICCYSLAVRWPHDYHVVPPRHHAPVKKFDTQQQLQHCAQRSYEYSSSGRGS